MKKKLKAIYVGDPMGDLEEEAKAIEEHLTLFDLDIPIKVVQSLWEAINGSFDVLFFDWGGMTIGNSLLESNCEHLLEDAHEHPTREYVLNSEFTKLAMQDAIEMADRNPLGRPANLFLTVEEWAERKRKR